MHSNQTLEIFLAKNNVLKLRKEANLLSVAYCWLYSSFCADEIVVLVLQLQLWLENPMCQLTFKNALPKIEAPYNSE